MAGKHFFQRPGFQDIVSPAFQLLCGGGLQPFTGREDIAVASLSPVGTSRALIAVLGAMLGGMLGIFMAFMVEFAARVRESEDG